MGGYIFNDYMLPLQKIVTVKARGVGAVIVAKVPASAFGELCNCILMCLYVIRSENV